jgi:hypothetical protein
MSPAFQFRECIRVTDYITSDTAYIRDRSPLDIKIAGSQASADH